MIVAVAGLAGVIVTALLTFLASRKTASTSELASVMDESRAMRAELRAEAATLRADAEAMRVRLTDCELMNEECMKARWALKRQLVDAGVIEP